MQQEQDHAVAGQQNGQVPAQREEGVHVAATQLQAEDYPEQGLDAKAQRTPAVQAPVLRVDAPDGIGQTENADAQNMMEPANAGSVGFDVDTAAAETAAEPAPERKPSRRRPSRAKKANAESAVAADETAADVSAKPGDGDVVSADEAAQGQPVPTKRRRRSSSRTKKEAPNSEQQAETQVENI